MIIGISGKIAAGKDTVAQMLSYIFYRQTTRDYLGYENHRYYNRGFPNIYPFAGRLKKCAAVMLGMNEAAMYHRDSKEAKIPWLGKSVREVLQFLGNTVRENLDKDFWVKSLFINREGDLIIPDVRYKNEATAVRSRGGILIRVNRPGFNGDGHISETELDNFTDFHYVINNDGNLEELYNKVLAIADDIRERQKGVVEM